jgi:glycosyltransferase involved in cell wall biosynthesis
MHIQILCHYAGSPYHGMEYRSYYLAKEWIKMGNSVTIVASTQSHIRTNNPQYKNKVTEEIIDGIKYIWIKTRKYAGNGIGRVLNMMDYITGVYVIISKLVQEKPYAVIASSTYPLDNYPAYKIARKSGAKYIYEVHDLWPLSPMEIGGYSRYHPFIAIMQKAENFAYAHVDKVISILPCAEEHMREHGLACGKFTHIPNGISLDELAKQEPLNRVTADQIPKNKFIVGYTGTFGLANSLDTLLEAASIIQEKNDDIFFVLIGKGPEKENLLKLQKKLLLKNCVILETIPKNQVQTAIALFSISVIALFSISVIVRNSKSSLYRFGISPNKLFDYMYAGKPIIQAIDAGNDIVGDANCGLTIPPQNPHAMADAIINLYETPEEERLKMGDNAKQYVLKNHLYETLAKKFIRSI